MGERRLADYDRRPRQRERRKREKRSKMAAVSTVILVVAVCVFLFAGYQMIKILLPYYVGGSEYDEVRDLAINNEKENKEKEKETEEEAKEFSINFGALIERNADTVGWIRFDEPSIISYPVVKSRDNNEYLTRTFSANDNKLGAIFMDMHNSTIFSDRNTIIYGHHLNVGGEMFSQLNRYAEETFCREYPYFYIYTPDGKMSTYKIFSAGIVKATAENYRLNFNTDQEFLEFLTFCRQSSDYDVAVNLDKDSQIVTLSTCTNENEEERFIVQGVLVSQE